MSLLRIIRHTNIMLTSGFTAILIYVKINNFSACRQMLNEKKDRSLLLPTPVISLVKEVVNEMNLEEEDRSNIKFFFSETSDFIRHGRINDQRGAVLGIPQHFVIDENTDVTVSTVDKKHKFTDIKESHTLEEHLRLSYEAKKFAIARELYELLYSNDEKLYVWPMLVNFKFVFLSYFTEKISKKRLKKVNYLFHIALFFMGAIFAILSHDLIIFYTETNADFLACDLGKSYINGGIEYYSKMIKRNKVLKKINNSAPYSEDGDVNYSLFGRHHIPLKRRLIYLRDLRMKKQKPSVWDYIILPYFQKSSF